MKTTPTAADLKATYPELFRAYVAQFHHDLGPNGFYRQDELDEYIGECFLAPMRRPDSCSCARGGNPAYCECKAWEPEFRAARAASVASAEPLQIRQPRPAPLG